MSLRKPAARSSPRPTSQSRSARAAALGRCGGDDPRASAPQDFLPSSWGKPASRRDLIKNQRDWYLAEELFGFLLVGRAYVMPTASFAACCHIEVCMQRGSSQVIDSWAVSRLWDTVTKLTVIHKNPSYDRFHSSRLFLTNRKSAVDVTMVNIVPARLVWPRAVFVLQ